MTATERVGRQLSVAGGLLTTLAVLAPPAVFFGLSYQHAAGSLEAEAEISSIAITRIIAANPDLWTFEKVRLAEFLARRPRHHDAEHRRVLDLEGRVVAESAEPVPAPRVVRSLPLLDAGVPVGRIEISRSMQPLLLTACLLGLVLLPLAVAAFVMLRSVPLRAIRSGERALRRQRDAAQSYLDAAGVAFVRIDEAFRVTMVNRQAEAVLGRAATEVVGQPWIGTFVQPGAREEVADRLAALPAGEVLALEHAVVRPDGVEVVLAWFVTRVADEEGRPGLLASGIDLTRQRDLERQLSQAQKLEAIGRLAGGVAHEFNNILAVIKVYGAGLTQGLPRESQHRADAGEILAAADRGAAVVRGLLTFSRLRAVEAVPIDLAVLVRSIERLLRPLLRSEIQLEVSIPGTPVPVLVDPVQIEQVLINLVTNGRDAIGGAGRIRLSVSTERLDVDPALAAGLATPGPYARIDVADDGSGLDAATRRQIFEPFFSTKEVGQGTGLGLAIVHGIVVQHRGAISCTSAPGQGATFSIWLPLRENEVSVAGPVVQPASQSPPGGTETILLAEDDPALRQVLKRLLERSGYTVLQAGDGLEAVALFETQRERIDLLLLDVIMPGQNGRQALDRIRALAPAIPALFLSGHAADPSDQRTVDLGGERLLSKPVEPDQLLVAVREQIDGGAWSRDAGRGG